MSRFVSVNDVILLRKNICAVEQVRRRPGALSELVVYCMLQAPTELNPDGFGNQSIRFSDEDSCTRAYHQLVEIVQDNVKIL